MTTGFTFQRILYDRITDNDSIYGWEDFRLQRAQTCDG